MLKKIIVKAMLGCMLTAGLIYTTTASAQNLSQQLPIDNNVTVGKLDNGLTYYIRPNAKPENKVELRLVLKAGSILEDEKQLGLAHFMEHMNFNGSKNFEKNELVNYLQSIGVDFGADLNAYTGFDQTVYILPIPTDKPGNLEKGFQIIEDWAHNALITDEDVNEERGVVLEESRARGKNANDRMMQAYLPRLLAGSRYADRLPIGKDELLKTFKPEEVRRFYHDWYRPNLMAVVVVGDISKEKAEEMIKKHFAGIQNPKNEKPREYAEIKPYKGGEAMVVTDKEATNEQFILTFSGRPIKAEKTLGDYKTHLVRSIFTQMLNKRYSELAQSSTPPFIFANAFVGSFISDKYESFTLMGMPSTDINKTIDAAIAEFLKAQQYGFTASELELAKKNLLSNVEKSYNERNSTESSVFVEEYINNFLNEEPIPGISNEYNYYKEILPSITLEEVTKEANEWLAPKVTQDYFALLTGPESADKKMPTEAELLSTVKKSFQQKVTANEEKKVAENLLEKEPVPGKIVGTETNDKLGTTTYTLSNGVKVTVKKTDFKSDEILFEGVKKGGTNNYGAADKSNTQFISEVMESMGYGNFTPTELTDALSGKTVSLQQSLGEISCDVNGSSSVKDFQSLMELTYLQMTSPRLDQDLYKGFVSKMKTQLMFMKANPQVVFVDTLIKRMYNNNPLRPIAVPTAEDLDKINPERVLEIYKKEFGNANGFHFFLVGNVDEATLKPLLEKYIASLPSDKSISPSFKDNGVRLASGNQRFDFLKGKDPKSLIVDVIHGEIPYTEDMALHTTIIGDILTIRLLEEVREKMGAIYGGGYSASMERDPYPHYAVQTQLQCGPENVDKIIAKLNDLVKEMKDNGPSQENLDKAKASIQEKRRENLKKNNYWMSKLQQIQFWGYSQDRFLNIENVVDKISVADIKATANKLFDGKNEFLATMKPEVEEEKK